MVYITKAPAVEEGEERETLLLWVDSIPLSRPKVNLSRDFADGVLIQEIVAYYFPKVTVPIPLKAANSKSRRRENWELLNTHVFPQLDFKFHSDDIEAIISAQPTAAERALKIINLAICYFKDEDIEPQIPVVKPTVDVRSMTLQEMKNDEIDDEVRDLYKWVDKIPLTRPKKDIKRDFADGVLMAELLHYYFPKCVHLHSYVACNSYVKKKQNWETINKLVCEKYMGFRIPDPLIEDVINCQPNAIERVLAVVRIRTRKFMIEYDDREEELIWRKDHLESYEHQKLYKA